MLSNRLIVGMGLIGSLLMIGVLLLQVQHPAGDVVQQFGYGITAFAALVSALACCFAIGNIDAVGITTEGRVTAIIPIALAACGLALTVRWAPERTPYAVAWMLMHIPGILVGIRTPTSSLQKSLRRDQLKEDQRIATAWELKQITNRVHLLEQLVRASGPDPVAQKKLATTGNSLEKYYSDTKDQIDKFLQHAGDESQRATASNLLLRLQQMNVQRP